MITDDDSVVRESYRQLIDMHEDMKTVAEAASGLEAIHVALEVKPDVLLMDLHMPSMDGVEATRRICARDSTIRVLVVTIFDQPEDVEAAVIAGAAGFIVKNGPLTDLLRAIRILHTGGGMLSPEVTTGIIDRMRNGGSPAPVCEIENATGPLIRMTERESEMLQLIAHGKSNGEIASELYLAQSSVKTYVSRLRAKLGARTRSELVTLYYESVRGCSRREARSAKIRYLRRSFRLATEELALPSSPAPELRLREPASDDDNRGTGNCPRPGPMTTLGNRRQG